MRTIIYNSHNLKLKVIIYYKKERICITYRYVQIPEIIYRVESQYLNIYEHFLIRHQHRILYGNYQSNIYENIKLISIH